MSENSPEIKPREIKVPPAQIWREFRMRFMPLGVFALALCAAVYLWNITVMGPTMVGQVEAVQSLVVAPEGGYITNLLVRPFQVVKAGDPIVEIISTDVRQISSQVQDLRSRIALSQMEVSSVVDRERIALDYQSLAMNTMRFRADLAASRAELPTLEAAAKRAEQGWKDQVVPYNDYELAIRTRDSVQARVTELEKLVADAEVRVQQAASSAGAFTNFSDGSNFPDAIKRLAVERNAPQESRQNAVILRAPISGTVGHILHRPGENVVAGAIIMTIHASEGDRIVAYIRPGYGVLPKAGGAVHVRCRTLKREQAVGKIENVGYRYEGITNTALLRPGVTFELGMPFAIEMPASLKTILHPGELVDLDVAYTR
jgi:multidrug resistance efflux pump